jgi:hypothetical protein
MIVREATVADIESLSFIRMSVKENILNNPALVTEQDYIKPHYPRKGMALRDKLDSDRLCYCRYYH